MKTLLLGRSGYLGAKLHDQLTTRGCDVMAPTRQACDLEEPGALLAFCSQHGPFDLVVNCAVFQLTGDGLVKSQREILYRNTRINLNFLDLLDRIDNNMHVLTVGASCAFSAVDDGTDYLQGSFHRSVTCFAAPKRQLAQILNYNGRHSWAVVVPGTLIGPGEKLRPSKKHFFNGAIFRAAQSIADPNAPFEVFGDMSAERELSLVDMVASEVAAKAVERAQGVIPLTPDFCLTVGQLYQAIVSRFLESKLLQEVETVFDAQSQKTGGMQVRHDLTRSKPLDHPEFLDVIDKTMAYYLAALKSARDGDTG